MFQEKFTNGRAYAKDQYDLAKLKALGFAPPVYEDKSELGYLTQFEQDVILPVFGRVSIIEFERRLKKLVTEENDDRITEE